jgi:hypothetical protein
MPSTGMLLLDGIPVAPGQDISAADLAAGKLSFALSTTPSDTVSDAFTFQVNDGTTYSASSYTFTVSVIPNLAADSSALPPGPATTNEPSPPAPASSSPSSALPPITTQGAAPSTEKPDAQEANGNSQETASTTDLTSTMVNAVASQQSVQSATPESNASESLQSRSAAARHGGFLIRTASFEPARFGIALAIPASLQTDVAAVPGATQNATFLQELDRLRESMQSEVELEQRIVGSAVAIGTGLSVGYVIWLLRGGLLVTSLLSSLPAWRYVDPLPVLGRLQGDEEEDDESLESMVDRSGITQDEEDHG